MMITKSDNSPVSSFDSTLQAALRAGATKQVRVKFPTRQLATRFTHRLNGLRLAMRKANHQDWEQLYRCGIHRDKDDNTIVVLAPRDSEFESFIRAAGVDPSTGKVTETLIMQPPEKAPIDLAEDFLASLRTDVENGSK